MITEEDFRREYVNAEEAANMIKVNKSRIRQICLAGRFTGAFKVGNIWFIPRTSVNGYNLTKLKPGPRTRKRTRLTDREVINDALKKAVIGKSE